MEDFSQFKAVSTGKGEPSPPNTFDTFPQADGFNQQAALQTASPTTGGDVGAGGYQQPVDQSEGIKSLITKSTGVDKFKGVDDGWFRAGWSRTDTHNEKAKYLNERVGKGNWKVDPDGSYIINPVGLSKIGIQSEYSRPVDEHGASLYDLADFAGDAPAILGGLGGSLMATGLGATAGVLSAGAGAAAGKAIDEAVEYFEGKNTQTGGEVAADIAKAGLEGVVGEGVYRGGSAVVGKLLRPNKVSPEMLNLAKEAENLGVELTPAQVADNSLLTRFQGLSDAVLGNEIAAKNARAFDSALAGLGAGRGNKGKAGKALVKDIQSARKSLRDWSASAWKAVDDATGGQPFIPTAKFKQTVQDLQQPMLDANGDVIPAFAKDYAELSKMSQLPDLMTAEQMQRISNSIDFSSTSLTPTIDSRTASLLTRGVDKSYDDVANVKGGEVAAEYLNFARKEYAKRISKFDDKIIEKIVKDPTASLAFEPEKAVSAILRKDSPEAAKRVMKLASPSTKKKIKRTVIDELIDAYRKEGKSPTEILYDGVGLKRVISRYGKKTLKELIGSDTLKSLETLAEVTRVAGQGSTSGGLVAANIALSPLQNAGTLVHLRILSKLLRSKLAMKWLTEGFGNPNSSAGRKALRRLPAYITALADSEKADYHQRFLARQQAGEQ